MTAHQVVTHDQWLTARKEHLAKEKEFTRLRDQLSKERRDLPWELVVKEYVFEGENGRQALAEVFDGRSQLVIYHAMFSPETAGDHTSWTIDAACHACSFWMDNFNGITVHVNHRDIYDRGRVTGALPEDRRLPGADGVVVPVVLLCGQRVQLRLPRLVHPGGAECG
jgi:predicted dithiol-disulfide oxidoreductase (DUF899 family)